MEFLLYVKNIYKLFAFFIIFIYIYIILISNYNLFCQKKDGFFVKITHQLILIILLFISKTLSIKFDKLIVISHILITNIF